MVDKALFSSQSDEWETPPELFETLDNIFHFNLDPCATKENAKCERYFTKEDNGLGQPWSGSKVFINPPYSHIRSWVEMAVAESCNSSKIIMLLPSRTDTKYFHEFIVPYNDCVWFIKGRLKFNGSKNSAPFPSMLVSFGFAPRDIPGTTGFFVPKLNTGR